ncbi:MAG TPA: hypothetical protein VMU48_16455 [Terracidiphilus sp.]|nr:hypothetical protein [Terracidiphilus sp.]
MQRLKPTFVLIARWRYGQTPYGIPDRVFWDDGSPATLEEYWAHELDTQECIRGAKGGVEVHIYPEIIADLSFDPVIGSWVLGGPGVSPAVLDEPDPEISDEMLLAALCRLPTFYRTRVHRNGGTLGCTYFLEQNKKDDIL